MFQKSLKDEVFEPPENGVFLIPLTWWKLFKKKLKIGELQVISLKSDKLSRDTDVENAAVPLFVLTSK